MLTWRDIVAEASVALRGSLSTRISEAQFVNRYVGSRWVGLHHWCYLDGRRASLEIEPGVTAYPLPLDLAEIDIISDTGGLMSRVSILAWPDWVAWSSRNYGPAAGAFWGAINHEVVDGSMRAVLHITPTPTEARSLILGYRGGWKPLTHEDDVANVPIWGEAAIGDLARLVARALHMPGAEIDPMATAVRQFMVSDTFRAARANDGMILPISPRQPSAMEQMLYDRQMSARGGAGLIGPRSTDQDLLADL
jgi:hypothetical protein